MYEKTELPREGLRLHLNENTGGCSRAVVDAVRNLSCEDAAYYPDYSEAIDACCRYLGVTPGQLILTNGLDEGILAASIVALRGSTKTEPLDALVVVPAFDMYAASADAIGGRVVQVPLAPDFGFPLDAVLAAVTPRTRIIFITDPNNPTGLSVPKDTVRKIAAAAPDALVFVDEAYAEFRGDTTVDAAMLSEFTNVVIGRTFAKAHGLAAIRIGAVVSAPETIEALRRVVPPYSVNVLAALALPAALADRAHLDGYVAQVYRSRELLYEALERLNVRYWRSDANFVLAQFGARASGVVAALRERGIYVRDRSKAPGCAGCVRITTGVVAHTDRAIRAIEEALCGAR